MIWKSPGTKRWTTSFGEGRLRVGGRVLPDSWLSISDTGEPTPPICQLFRFNTLTRL